MGIPLWWITEWDLMVGCDFHDEITATPPPVAVPMIPHVVGASMHWAVNTFLGGAFASRVVVEGRKPCGHMHDISLLIPHVPIPPYPPCVLLTVIIPMSQSKILLGAFTIICEGKPVGVHGLQLNCCMPVNLPLGTDIPTRLPTVWCGFSLMDLLASLIIGAIDVLVSFLIDKIFSHIPATDSLKGLANHWIRTSATQLLNRFTLGQGLRVGARELLSAAARKATETLADATGYLNGYSLLMQQTVARWNPHATVPRVAKAADEAVVFFADMIYDRTMGEQGVLPPMQEELGRMLDEPEDAERIINETRAEVTREEWRAMFDKSFGKDIRTTTSQMLWDYCAKVNALGGEIPPA